MSRKAPKNRRKPRGVYTIESKRVGGRFPYDTYRLRGVTLRGEEIRLQSTDLAKLEKDKAGLVAADGAASDEHNVLTHLTLKQVRAAESAYERIGTRTLQEVVSFYELNFEEAKTKKTLTEAKCVYVAEQKTDPDLSRSHIDKMEGDLDKLCAGPRGKLHPHQFMHRPHAQAFMKSLTFVPRPAKENGMDVANEKPRPRKVGHKRWNNVRGSCHAFFEWMRNEKNWCATNPFTKIKVYDTNPISTTAC